MTISSYLQRSEIMVAFRISSDFSVVPLSSKVVIYLKCSLKLRYRKYFDKKMFKMIFITCSGLLNPCFGYNRTRVGPSEVEIPISIPLSLSSSTYCGNHFFRGRRFPLSSRINPYARFVVKSRQTNNFILPTAIHSLNNSL